MLTVSSGHKAHSRNFKAVPFHARIDSLSFFPRNDKKALSFKTIAFKHF